MAIRAHTWFLSHDLLEGRATGTRGADVAAAYLASTAEQLGLRGAGAGGSFFQRVPLVEAVIDTSASALRLSIDEPIGTTRLTFSSPQAFIPNVGTLRTLVGFGGDLVYVGSPSGVLAHPEQLPPLAGRVALVNGFFGADRAAADTLRARGVTGVIHLLGQDQAYDGYVRARGPSRLSIADSVGAVSSFIPAIPAIIARPALARRLLPPVVTETDLAHPFVVTGRRVDVTLVVRTRDVPARNVAALLPGADAARRSEYVVYTAHYDHLGISTPDEHGDSIYNGFADDAAGSAMLLAIAQALSGKRPPYSTLFIWFTGEERGLLGSDYFVARALVPPSQIAAVINLDASAPPGPNADWLIAGGERSTLGALAMEVARQAGWEARPAPATPNSDHYPFLRIGVPAVFLMPGPAAFSALSAEESQARRRRWGRDHTAADEWAPDFPFSGLVRYAEYGLRLGLAVAAGPRPSMIGGP